MARVLLRGRRSTCPRDAISKIVREYQRSERSVYAPAAPPRFADSPGSKARLGAIGRHSPGKAGTRPHAGNLNPCMTERKFEGSTCHGSNSGLKVQRVPPHSRRATRRRRPGSRHGCLTRASTGPTFDAQGEVPAVCLAERGESEPRCVESCITRSGIVLDLRYPSGTRQTVSRTRVVARVI